MLKFDSLSIPMPNGGCDDLDDDISRHAVDLTHRSLSLTARRRYEPEPGQLQVTVSRFSISGQLRQCGAALDRSLT